MPKKKSYPPKFKFQAVLDAMRSSSTDAEVARVESRKYGGNRPEILAGAADRHREERARLGETVQAWRRFGQEGLSGIPGFQDRSSGDRRVDGSISLVLHDVLASLEDAIEKGLGQLWVMQHVSPLGQLLVGSEDDGPAAQATLVDDAVEHVGGRVRVVEVADLVDDEDVRLDVGGSGLAERTCADRRNELVDERRRGDEASLEAVLDGAIGERNGQVCLPSTRRAREDQIASFCNEFGPKKRPELLPPDAALEGEVELLDRLHVWEAGGPGESLDAGAGAIGDLLGEEVDDELAMGPAFGGGALLEVREHTRDRSQVKALQDGGEVDVVDVHHAASFRSAAATALTV